MREGDGEERGEEEEEEAEEELSGSSRCANLGPRDAPKQVKGCRGLPTRWQQVAAAGVHVVYAIATAWAKHITPCWAYWLSGILAVLM